MIKSYYTFLLLLIIVGCGSSGGGDNSSTSIVNLNITASENADKDSSYSNSKPTIHVKYSSIIFPRPAGTGDLFDAIAYLDADGDGDTDIFLATGEFLSQEEVNSILYINDGAQNFTSSTIEFGNNMPVATHTRKSIVSDFNNDGLKDIFVFDHGFDSFPFPGNQPKLILQNSVGSFTWSKLSDQTGFHHGGSAGDIDNDGDVDIFVGGFDPFFFINDGNANFTKVDNRFDNSIEKIFTAELIDIDQDGFIDLLVGASERDGNNTTIYWGSTSGAYSKKISTIIPATPFFGAVLDFDAEDIDSDGDRDLIINRTRDGDDGLNKGFYEGRTIQLLINNGERLFTDATINIDKPGGDSDEWFPWIRAQDIDKDGDIDFFPDDADKGFIYLNNGQGIFTQTPLTP